MANRFSYPSFFHGARDTVPMLVGAAPFGVLFGVLAIGSGLGTAATMATSLLVFAGSSQFVAAKLVADGTGLLVIVLATFVINLRHALYGASLAPYVGNLGQRWLLPLGFLLTDEAYAVAIRRYPKLGATPRGHSYHLGSAVAMFVNWQLWTLVGLVAGTRLGVLASWGLDFAMVVTFIGIVVPLVVDRPKLLAAGVAGATAVLAHGLPHQLGLLLAAFLGIAAGVAAERLTAADSDRHDAEHGAAAP